MGWKLWTEVAGFEDQTNFQIQNFYVSLLLLKSHSVNKVLSNNVALNYIQPHFNDHLYNDIAPLQCYDTLWNSSVCIFDAMINKRQTERKEGDKPQP